MSAWPSFLKALSGVNCVSLVGPFHDVPFTVSEPTVYVDGGTRARGGKSAFPCISVGDGDSSALKLDHEIPTEKDFSDLAFALTALPPNIMKLKLFGFLGGRRDHELANLGETHAFIKARAPGASAEFYVRDQLELRLLSAGSWDLEIHTLFSLFALEPAVVSISGACAYPITHAALPPLSSRGLSNVGQGRISVMSDTPLLLFQTKDHRI